MSFRLSAAIDCQARLTRDYIEFARAWATVKQDWRDDRSRRFEQEHLTTLGPSLNRLAAALQEFRDAIRKAELSLQDDHATSERLQ